MRHRNLNGTMSTSAIGFGAMVLIDGLYGHADDEQSRANTDPPRDRRRRDADRHLRRLRERARTRSWSAGRSTRRREDVQLATKWGIVSERRACDSARACADRSSSTPARNAPARRPRRACEPLGVEAHRPVVPALPGPGRAGRGDRGRDGGARQRRQGRPPRALQRHRRAGDRRPPGPPARRRPGRVLAVDPRPRARTAAGAERARHRVRALVAARRGLPRRLGGPARRATSAPTTRASAARTWPPTATASRRCGRSRPSWM